METVQVLCNLKALTIGQNYGKAFIQNEYFFKIQFINKKKLKNHKIQIKMRAQIVNNTILNL